MGINTVKNLYNDFIILQDFFPAWKSCFVYVFWSGIWYYLQYIAIYLRSASGAPLSSRTPKKHVLWPVQHLVLYSWFRSRMKTKQKPVDILNHFNDTVLISVMFVSVLQPNTTFYLLKQWCSIWGVPIYRRKSCVCNH